MILSANLVSTDIDDTTDVEDSTEQIEKISHGLPVFDRFKYPYFVSLQYPDRTNPGGYRHFCGGSLITRQIVITAAHCLFNLQQIPGFRILPNYRNTPYIGPSDRTFKIARYVIYPGFDRRIFQHDIAVLLLDQPDARNGATIRLPIADVPLQAPLTIIGFGKIENEIVPNELLSAVVYKLADQICRYYIDPALYIRGTICAGNAIKSGICTGDSGGPLIREVNGISYLQGISSTYFPPCGSNRVSSYVNVLPYLEFINRAVSSLTGGGPRSDEFNIQWTQNDSYTTDGSTVDYA
uniref:Peptidase S1 domain-containing protein n=2 Tax=Tetranychus urticae TaxID=32264 RepID=T1K8Z8_TETUR